MISGLFRGRASFWAFSGACILGVFLMGLIGTEPAAGTAANTPATVEEARAFTDSAEKKLLDLWIKSSRASWVQQTFHH